SALGPDIVGQPGSPVLIAICCCFPTSVTTCGGMGSPGALSNSSRTTALPSVNNSTVTALAPSGEVPDTTVPPVPTGDGCGRPPVTVVPRADTVVLSVVVAAALSGRTT